MTPKEIVLQNRQVSIDKQIALVNAVTAWQKEQLQKAFDTLHHFLLSIERRRVEILDYFDESLDLRISVSARLDEHENRITVYYKSSITLIPGGVQPVNIFWSNAKIEQELCILKANDIYESTVNIAIFNPIELEKVGEISDYMKKHTVNYTPLQDTLNECAEPLRVKHNIVITL